MEKVREAIDLLSSALSEDNSFSTARSSFSSIAASFVAQSSASTEASTVTLTETIPSTRTSHALLACSEALTALTHLKQMRSAEQKSNFQSYKDDKCAKAKQASNEMLMATASKFAKQSSWSHKFVCLALKSATKVPATNEKNFLASIGLGERVIKFLSLEVMLDEFQDIIKRQYPPLEKAGGFDLLRCKPNSRELEEVPYMVTYPLPLMKILSQMDGCLFVPSKLPLMKILSQMDGCLFVPSKMI